MRNRWLAVSILLATSCAGPANGNETSNLAACSLGDISEVCSATPIPITATSDADVAPAVLAGTTYAIAGPSAGDRSYIEITPTASGTHTLYFGDGEPIRVCDLTALCDSVVTSCPTLHRAAQYAMEAGVRYEIELRPIPAGHPFILHIVPPPPPPPPPPSSDIVFAATLDGQTETDLYIVGADGAGVSRLTSTPGGELYPSWSPDHSHIAFVRDAQLFVIDADGTNEHMLSLVGRDGKDLSAASWSPDGTQLVYPYPAAHNLVQDPDGPIDDSNPTDLHVINIDGTNDHAIPTIVVFGTWQPSWGPNNTVVFAVDNYCPDCEGDLGEEMIQSDGTNRQYVPIDLTPRPEVQAGVDWSPDGTRWVYTGEIPWWQYEAIGDIGSRPPFGSPDYETDVVMLSTNAWSPRWSADSQQVALIHPDGIYVVNRDGSGEHRVLAATAVRGLDW